MALSERNRGTGVDLGDGVSGSFLIIEDRMRTAALYGAAVLFEVFGAEVHIDII